MGRPGREGRPRQGKGRRKERMMPARAAPESHAADNPLTGELAALDRALACSASVLAGGAKGARDPLIYIPIGRRASGWRPSGAPHRPLYPDPNRPTWPRPFFGTPGRLSLRSNARERAI
jgi:hypothetical protein